MHGSSAMTRAVKTSTPVLLPRLKIPTAEQFASESPEQALFRETIEALDAGTPAQLLAWSMQDAGVPEEDAKALLQSAMLQLPVARHNAEMFLESRGDPKWCGAKHHRAIGWTLVVIGVALGVAVTALPAQGIHLPKTIMVLGEVTWTIGAGIAMIGGVLIGAATNALKRIRRSALTKRP